MRVSVNWLKLRVRVRIVVGVGCGVVIHTGVEVSGIVLWLMIFFREETGRHIGFQGRLWMKVAFSLRVGSNSVDKHNMLFLSSRNLQDG